MRTLAIALVVIGIFTLDDAAAQIDYSMTKEITATVTKVHDGDTLTMLIDNRPVNIRLAEIDAPEAGQPFYKASRDSLRALCAGQRAAFRQTDWDGRFQRPVGRVVCRQTDVGIHQVTNGMAWVFDRYADPNSLLYPRQAAAMAARRGLWVEEDPMPPWEWRVRNRKEFK